MINNKVFIFSIIALIIILVLILLLYPILKWWMSESFFNGSGYGLNSNFGKINTLVPLNNVTKSTDFKLFSLLSQIKFSMVKPPGHYIITNTEKGIISYGNNMTKTKNIILFPGQTDYVLEQNNNEVWPKNWHHMNNSNKVTVKNNNDGHFNTITTLLENLGYQDNFNLNTIIYDFRNIDFDYVIKQFLNYLKEDTVIIAYDFGAVISNICINSLPKNNEGEIIRSKIKKCLLICPTLGGTPMTLRDYFSGNNIIDTDLLERYDSILLSMPNKNIYEDPVAIYNSLSYNANNIEELMKKDNKPFEVLNNLRKIQDLSLQNPNVDCIIVTSEQFNTPMCYNFRDNLKNNPERYYSKNNNQFPLTDIQHNGTFEGIQTKGDKIVPINSIHKIKKMWGNNCIIENIRDKDHFTILKSYELALIIMSNL